MPPEETDSINVIGIVTSDIAHVTMYSGAVYKDERGWLAEVARAENGEYLAMTYVSATVPDVVRGPHEHRNQTDRFFFCGPAVLWLWDARPDSPTYKHRQKVVFSDVGSAVIPPGVVHAYKADSLHHPLVVVNVPDRLYKGHNKTEPVDEIRHEDDPDTPFKPW
jgi:dTDP-4-dehydrorhamnose 3,5-epimerase